MTTIQDMLANLNANFSQVTDLIPNRLNLLDDPALDEEQVEVLGQVVFFQSDGKLLFGSRNYWSAYDADTDSSKAKNILLRYNTDGTIDSTFSPPLFGDYNGEMIRAIAQQSDGKIIVGGTFEDVNGVSSSKICRLNTDGSLDETFDIGTGFDNDVFSISIQSNDCIAVGGYFDSFDGNDAQRFTILNADGSFDSGLKGPNTYALGLDNTVHVVKVISGNKVLVGGQFTNKIICVDSSGIEDTGFDVGTGFTVQAAGNARVGDFAIQDDGKILVSHWFKEYNGVDIPVGLTRLNTDGTLDASFHFYRDTPLNIEDIAVSSGGLTAITVTGHGLSNNDMVRIQGSNSDADIDGDYRITVVDDDIFTISLGTVTVAGDEGTVTKSLGFNDGIDDDNQHRVQAVAIQSDGKIIVGGWFTKFGGEQQNYIVRLDENGAKDETFDVATKFYLIGLDQRVQDIAIDSDDNVYLAHDLYFYDGNPTYGLTKLDSTGEFQEIELLLSSDPDLCSYDFPNIYKIKKQGDGKIVVVGQASRVDGGKYIRRLNSDGSEDNTFQPIYIEGSIRDFDFQGSKIIVVGDFYIVNQYALRNVMRLNSDGTVDETFNMSLDFSSTIFAVKVDSANKIWVGGNFTQVDGVTVNRLCQLDENGEVLWYNANLRISSIVHVIEEDEDGKILIGGQFNTYTLTISEIATGDGTVEITTTSNHSLQTGDYVYIASSNSTPNVDGIWEVSYVDNNTFSIESTVTVAGDSGMANRFPHNYLFRLNANKTIDDTFITYFNNSFGNNPRVSSVAIQENGKIIVGHWFENYGENASRGVTRINSDGTYDSTFQNEGSGLEGGYGGTMVVKLDADENVYVGGFFTSYNELSQKSLIKLNNDGTKDTSFDIGLGFDDHTPNNTRVNDILVVDDGIFCVGSFSILQQTIRWNVVKIDLEGNIVLDFKVPLPFKTTGISNSYGDLFDGGCFINTNLTNTFAQGQKNYLERYLSVANTHSPIGDRDSRIPSDFIPENQDGTVEDGERYFGAGSSYFTNIYPGLLVMVATEVNPAVTEASILGESADNPSNVVISELELNGGFKAICRKEIDGESNCLHQMIIINGTTNNLDVNYSNSGGDNDISVANISANKIFVLTMVAEGSESEISDEDLIKIGNKFLGVLGVGYKTFNITLSMATADNVGPRNIDTAILNGKSIQKTGIMEIVNSNGERKVEVFNDGDTFTDEVQTLEDYLPIQKI